MSRGTAVANCETGLRRSPDVNDINGFRAGPCILVTIHFLFFLRLLPYDLEMSVANAFTKFETHRIVLEKGYVNEAWY